MSSPVAVLPFWKDYDRKLYLRAAILADELGYDSFWIPEAWGYEVFSLLTEIALNTRRIKLGTGIVNVFSRSEGLHYAQRLLQAGVSVELHAYPGTFHGSSLITDAAISRRQWTDTCAALTRALGLPATG